MSDRAERCGKIARNGADINALAGFRREFRPVIVEPAFEAQFDYFGGTRRQVRLLVGTGQVVGPLSSDLDRGISWRHLHDPAGERRQRAADRIVVGANRTGFRHTAVGIVGIAGLAPAQSETIDLAAVHDPGDRLGRLAESDGQHPGRKRVQRPAMPDLGASAQSLDPVADRGGGHPGGLVHDNPAIEVGSFLAPTSHADSAGSALQSGQPLQSCGRAETGAGV